MVAQIIEDYYYLSEPEKARKLAARMGDELLQTAFFYLEWGSLGQAEFETASRVLLYVADVCKQYGDKELGNAMVDSLEALLKSATGSGYGLERSEKDTVEVQK